MANSISRLTTAAAEQSQPRLDVKLLESRRGWLPSLLGLASLAVLLAYAYPRVDTGRDTIPVQAAGLGLALAWTLFSARTSLREIFGWRPFKNQVHPAWLLVFLAVGLRFFAYSIFPLADQTGFEEMQTGSIAYSMLRTHDMQIEFRLTNLVAALGLAAGNGTGLSSLRLPFQIDGLIGLLLLVWALRSLRLSWVPTLVVTSLAATLRILVMASSFADELFAALPVLTLFLVCDIRYERAEPPRRSFWAACAGLSAGFLMFEYTSFRTPVFVWLLYMLVTLAWPARASGKEGRTGVFRDLLSFSIPLCLVAAPVIAQMLKNPQGAVFLEGFFRHGQGRTELFSSMLAGSLKGYLLALTGFPSPVSAVYTPVGEPFIPTLVGCLFAAGALFCLSPLSPRIGRLFLAQVAITILGASLFANNQNIGRMVPTLPVLLLMAGLFLEWGCRQVLRAWHGLAEKQGFSLIIQPHAGQTSLHIDSDGLYLWFGRLSAGLLLGLTFVGITHSNLASLRRMAADPQVIMEYINNDYSICAFIGANQGPSQRVYLYSIDRNNECTTNRGDGWYYGSTQTEVLLIDGLGGSLGRLNPGDVVAMAARNRGLTEEELASLLDFGAALGSQTSFQTGKDISGDTTVASICYRCAP